MNFIGAIKSGFRNYVNFSGRSIRSEYWYWTLFAVIVSIVIGEIDEWRNPGAQLSLLSPFSGFDALGWILFLPSLSIAIRRLHDIDYSGWWFLLGFTGIGALVLLYWACLRGTVGANRFGADPMPAT